MLNLKLIAIIGVAMLAAFGYVWSLQKDIKQLTLANETLQSNVLTLDADREKLKAEQEQLRREYARRESAMLTARAAFQEGIKRRDQRINNLETEINNVQDKKVKECFDTVIPDSIADGLFNEAGNKD